MVTMLRIAFRNLLQARRRTLLLGFAVAVVALLFLMLRTVGASVSERMIEAATTLSAGHVNVGGFYKVRKNDSFPMVTKRADVLKIIQENVPEAEEIIDRNSGWGRLISPASSQNSGVRGIDLNMEGRLFRNLRLAEEKEYRKNGSDKVFGTFEELRRPNTAVLFASHAKKLEVGVGDTVTYVTEASGGESNTVDLEVVAIASDLGFMSGWTFFVPRDTLMQLYQLAPDTTGLFMVYLKDPADATKVMERLRDVFKKHDFRVMDHDPIPFFMKFEKVAGEDWVGQQIDLTIWSDEISFMLWITTAIDLVTFFVVSVLALIIIGGIMNSMWMAVRERTKEIGTMRAIGTPKSFIVGLFMTEAVMLGLFASLTGVALGTAILAIINLLQLPITNDGVRLFLMTNTLAINIHLTQVVSTLILFSSITGLAALYPAWKASRLRPVEALMQGK